MQVYKRQQISTSTSNTDFSDPNTQKLQTLGMRIRQSVSNGYQLPAGTNVPTYMNNYEQQQKQNNLRRVQMPTHLLSDGPPALDYNGSTASSLSCWEDELNRTQNFHSLQSFYSNDSKNLKRGFDDVESKDMQVNDYINKYGPLSFNEEF